MLYHSASLPCVLKLGFFLCQLSLLLKKINHYRQLTIRSYSGNPVDTVALASSLGDHAFYVTANNVKISGLTVSGASQNAPYSGIYLAKAKGCTLENNIVSGNWYGISLDNSASDILNNNVVNSNSGFPISTPETGE